MKPYNIFVLVLVVFLVYVLFFRKSPSYDGFCNPDELRVSGACRKTCFEGRYNPGTKSCY